MKREEINVHKSFYVRFYFVTFDNRVDVMIAQRGYYAFLIVDKCSHRMSRTEYLDTAIFSSSYILCFNIIFVVNDIAFL